MKFSIKKTLGPLWGGLASLLIATSATAQINPNDMIFALSGFISQTPVPASQVIPNFQQKQGELAFVTTTPSGAPVVINFLKCQQGAASIQCGFVLVGASFQNVGGRMTQSRLNSVSQQMFTNTFIDPDGRVVSRLMTYAPVPMGRELFRAMGSTWNASTNILAKSFSVGANSISYSPEEIIENQKIVIEPAKTPGDELAERKITASLNRAQSPNALFVSNGYEVDWLKILTAESDALAAFAENHPLADISLQE